MKKYVFFLCLMLTLLCFPIGLNLEKVYFANAEGEQQNVKEISDLEGLKQIDSNLDGNYILTDDIVVTDTVFNPIGAVVNGENVSYSAFTGSFDGNGHTIKGLRLDGSGGYDNLGLFGKIENAQIKNLKVEVVYVNFNTSITDISSVNIGGIAGTSVTSTIEQCAIEYVIDTVNYDQVNLQFSISTRNSLNFGGVVANAEAGTTFKNCYANVVLDKLEKNMSQGVIVSVGGLVGQLNNSYVYNCHSTSDFNFVTATTNDSITVSLGGVAGYVVGANTSVVSVYSVLNLQSSHQYNFGSIFGLIDKSVYPAQNSLNYIYSNSNFLLDQTQKSLELFGQKNNYNNENGVLENKNDFSVFDDMESFSTNYYWDFENVWSKTSSGLPQLQCFKTYSVSLSTIPMIDFGLLTPSENVVTIEYEQQGFDPDNVRFGQTIKIKIQIHSNYTKYFKLDSIFVSNIIVYDSNNLYENKQDFKVTLPVNDELNPENNTDYYLLEYKINDNTVGQVSISLDKVVYNVEVFTEDSSMGKVKNQYASKADSFIQTVAYGLSYSFDVQVESSSYAFLNWAFVKDGEDNVIFESDRSNFSFVFGQEPATAQDINEFIISGKKLMAQWTSNVCSVDFVVQYKNGQSVDGCEIYDSETLLNSAVGFIKGSEVNLTAKVKEGFTFVGWYDGSGKILSSSEQLTYLLDSEYDQMTFVVKVEPIEKNINLTWLWITLGTLGGLAAIGAIVFVIIKKSKDNAYKNFY